eukprot:8056983-Prorocentrum_lima.AAC.1
MEGEETDHLLESARIQAAPPETKNFHRDRQLVLKRRETMHAKLSDIKQQPFEANMLKRQDMEGDERL